MAGDAQRRKSAAQFVKDWQGRGYEIIGRDMDFLPLKTSAHIVEGNALRLDWGDVVPQDRLDYIMGNPPFRGARYMDAEQKEELLGVFPGVKNAGNLDYVACWYGKAAELMQGAPHVHAAFVSTNSVTQEADEKQRDAIARTAQGILDVRAAHAGSTLADLYDISIMAEAEIVARLMERYAALTGGRNAPAMTAAPARPEGTPAAAEAGRRR